MATLFNILFVVLNLLNIILQTIILYLILNVERKNIPQLYLLNLSITELLKNVVLFLILLPDIISLSENMQLIFDHNHIYLRIIYDYGIMTSYYLTMVFIVMDRYFRVLFDIKYVEYWNIKKARLLVLGTWALGIIITIMISILCKVTVDYIAVQYFIYFGQSKAPFVTYSTPGVDIAFIGLAIPAYHKILSRYTQSKKGNYSTSDKHLPNAFELFYRSTNCIPILISSAFIVLTITPDLVFTCYKYTNREIPFLVDVFCYISYATCDLAHALIYIYIKKPSKRMLSKSIHANLSFIQRIKHDKGRYSKTVHLPYIVGNTANETKKKSKQKMHLSDMYTVELSTKRGLAERNSREEKRYLFNSQEDLTLNKKYSVAYDKSTRNAREDLSLKGGYKIHMDKSTRNAREDLSLKGGYKIHMDKSTRNAREDLSLKGGYKIQMDKSTRNAREDSSLKGGYKIQMDKLTRSLEETASFNERSKRRSSRNSKEMVRLDEGGKIEKDKSGRKIGTYDLFAHGRSTGCGNVIQSTI